MRKWKLLTVTTSESYYFDGANVFDAEDSNKICIVKDPLYKQKHFADIYYLKGETAVYKIAMTEFSCGVYGIYMKGKVREKHLSKCKK